MFMLRFFALLIGAAFAFNVAANAATYVVNDAGDRNDANLANPACADAFGLCTLRAAVEQANATPTSTYHVILLQSGQPYDLTLVGAGEDDAVTGDLDVKTNLAVWVLGGASAEVRGQRADRVFDVHPGGYLYLYRVDPTGGSVSDRGGAIRVRDGLLFVRESRVASSNASNGGCISLDDGSKGWVYASTITKCRAGAGGGLWASASQLTVQTRSVVYGNSANAGGGIAAEYSRVGVYDTFVEQNLSNVKSGGGISNYKASGPLEVHRTNFWHNESKQGGAIHHQGGVANVSDSYFIGNRTSPGTFIYQGEGGAIYSNAATLGGTVPSTLTLHNSHLKFNVADGPGGGLALGEQTTAKVTRTTFEINVAASGSNDHHGGGIAVLDATATLDLENSTLVGNAAAEWGAYGGGLYNVGYSTLRYNTFYLNFARPEPPFGFFGGGSALANILTGSGTAHANILFSDTGEDACIGALSMASFRYNADDDYTCFSSIGDTTVTTPFTVISSSPANNGGDPTASGEPPYTLEMYPTASLRDWVPLSWCSTPIDQRGFGRPVGAGCSVGAFEAGATMKAKAGGGGKEDIVAEPPATPAPFDAGKDDLLHEPGRR